MVRSRDVVQAEGSARTEGARRATGVRADGAAAGAGSLAPGQRWSASRKRDVVLRLLRGESLEALSREVGVEIYRLEAWRERAMAGLELGLKDRHGEPVAAALDAAKASHRGAVDGDRAAPRAGPGRGAAPPCGDAEVVTMSATTSAATGRCFGIQRVCQVLGALALGALRATGAGTPPGGRGAGAAGAAAEAIGRAAAGGDSCRSRSVSVPRRRPSQGPRTASDPGWDPSRSHAGAARHAGARAPLPVPRASGRREGPRREGHHPGAQRDVGDGRRAGMYARRRVGLDLRGGRTLERGVRGVARVQSREPLRGTRSDCARAQTSLWLAGRRRRPPGWRFGWITGVSTCQTTSSSRSGIGGSTPASALSRNRKRTVWRSGGNRTLKEQAIHGRIFQNLEAVRAAVADSVERYNQTWRLEKLGYQTPIEAREEYELRQAA